jgi:hypothetical protein
MPTTVNGNKAGLLAKAWKKLGLSSKHHRSFTTPNNIVVYKDLTKLLPFGKIPENT